MSRGGEGSSLNPDTRTHRTAVPVTDCSRNRTKLLIALKLSEGSHFFKWNRYPRVDIRRVGYSALFLCLCAGIPPLRLLQLHRGASLCWLQRDTQRGQCMPLRWVRAYIHCSSRGISQSSTRHIFSPLETAHTPLFHIYHCCRSNYWGTFEPLHESIGGLLNRNALKSFEKSSRCTASQNWFPWCRILCTPWIFLCCFSLL